MGRGVNVSKQITARVACMPNGRPKSRPAAPAKCTESNCDAGLIKIPHIGECLNLAGL